MNLKVNKSVRVATDSTVCDSVLDGTARAATSQAPTRSTQRYGHGLRQHHDNESESEQVGACRNRQHGGVMTASLWNGKSCYQSGTYTFNGVMATGCDSIVTMNLRANKSVRVAIDSTVS